MKGQLNRSGQVALRKESLDYGAFSLEEGIRERTLDAFSYGVIPDSQVNGESFPFEITSISAGTINVGTGKAIAPTSNTDFETLTSIDPLFGCDHIETGGERILISLADVGASGPAYSRVVASAGSGAGTGPYLETDDNIGGYAYTPASTGAKAIPLVDGVNRIWISYIPAIDPSTYAIHPITLARLFPKKLDGYEIYPTLSDVKPGPSDERYFKIGNVTVVGGAVTTIDQSMMPFAKTNLKRVGVKVDSTKAPSVYQDGTEAFLDDHINAIGSGVVSATDPHGLAVSDLTGYADIGVVHNQIAHVNGIRNMSSSTLGMSIETPGVGQKRIRVTQLAAQEYVIVYGVTSSEVLPKIIAENDAYVLFASAVNTGDYYVYLYMSGTDCYVEKVLISDPLPSSYILLGKYSWDSGTLVLALVEDYRNLSFGFTNSTNIQRRSIGSFSVALATVGSTGQNTEVGYGIKTDHIVDEAITDAKIVGMDASKLIGGITGGQIVSVAPDIILPGITGGQISSVVASTILPGITGGQLAAATITLDKFATDALPAPAPIRWIAQGDMMIATKVVETLVDVPAKINEVHFSLDAVPTPTSDDFALDVLVNGYSIFVTTPSIIGGSVHTGSVPGGYEGIYLKSTGKTGLAPTDQPEFGRLIGQIDVTNNSLAVGDKVRLDIISAGGSGSTGPGSDLTVTLKLAAI